jgi:hypothetical protein
MVSILGGVYVDPILITEVQAELQAAGVRSSHKSVERSLQERAATFGLGEEVSRWAPWLGGRGAGLRVPIKVELHGMHRHDQPPDWAAAPAPM